MRKKSCKGKPLGLTMSAGGMIVTVLAYGGEEVGRGRGGGYVYVQCLLQLKSGLRETRNGGEIGGGGGAGEFGGGAG